MYNTYRYEDFLPESSYHAHLSICTHRPGPYFENCMTQALKTVYLGVTFYYRNYAKLKLLNKFWIPDLRFLSANIKKKACCKILIISFKYVYKDGAAAVRLGFIKSIFVQYIFIVATWTSLDYCPTLQIKYVWFLKQSALHLLIFM